MKNILLLAAASSTLLIASCQETKVEPTPVVKTETPVVEVAANTGPTVQEAKEFLERSEAEIVELSAEAARIYWINALPMILTG